MVITLDSTKEGIIVNSKGLEMFNIGTHTRNKASSLELLSVAAEQIFSEIKSVADLPQIALVLMGELYKCQQPLLAETFLREFNRFYAPVPVAITLSWKDYMDRQVKLAKALGYN